ncbi:MAG: GUN4 domain-containing protein [Phormidesmis sp.]
MYPNATESPDSATRSDQSGLDSRPENSSEKIESLAADLRADSFKKRIQAVRNLAALGTAEADQVLVELLQAYGEIDPGSSHTEDQIAVCGCAYQYLCIATSPIAQSFVEQTSAGIVKVVSDRNVDYDELQQLLIQQNYQAADKLTTELMCEIAGDDAIKRKWVYFTEVSQFPNADILTIDTLWRTYSENKFGWSQQRNLWLRIGQDWEKLWPQINWKSPEGAWTRYPTEFVWDLASAPIGHLPLFNQLRGVRVMNALIEHPVWSEGKQNG